MVNLLYYIFTILCLSVYIIGADIPAIPNSVQLLRRTLLKGKLCSNHDDIWKCKDCHTVQQCNNNNNDYSFNCGDQFPGRPYCNKAAKDIKDMCVSDETVCEPDSVFCSSEGTFPSLTNCKAYHLCPSKYAPSFPYFCKYNTVYNHALKSCRMNSPCYTVTDECGTQKKVIPYRLDTSLYVICRGSLQPLLKSCAEGLYFDPASVRCEFKCPGEGAFANPVERYSYYMCYLDGDVLLEKLLPCPDGSKYDVAKKHCSLINTTSTTSVSTTTTPITNKS